MRRSFRRWSIVVFLLMVPAARSAGAQDRATLINRAREEFSDSAAFELLVTAVNPEASPIDSLWAVSVHEIALRLIGLNDPASALIWLRWSARHGATWPIDRSFFPPAVIGAYDQALRDTRGAADSMDMVTRWRWPSRFDPMANGSIEVSARMGGSVAARVEGRGSVPPGGSVPLPAGTYTILFSADGYESARVTREILPSVVTLLEPELNPVLPTSMPQVSVRRGGFPIKWVGAGALAAGAAAFFLSKGGGAPTTEGDIVINVPAGL